VPHRISGWQAGACGRQFRLYLVYRWELAKLAAMPIFITLLVVMISSTWASEGTPALEDQLRREYVGTERLLRYFYAADTLKFDAQGVPLNKERLASWTVAAPVVIEKLGFKGSKLRMQGHRQLLVFDNTNHRMTRIKSDETVSIEVGTTDGGNQEAQLRAALARIFVGKDEDLSLLLPDYWRDYIARFSGRKTDGEPCEGSTVKTDPNSTAPVKVSAGISEGMKIQNALPTYLPIAREHRVQGELEMRAVIDKNGNVGRICLTKALGAGLDDMMVETVRQWKYRPYLLNGQPVEIQTTIATKFGLRNAP
jgi:TonB family protein